MHLLQRTIPLTLVFALAACGGSNPPPNDAKSASDAESAPGAGKTAGGSSDATEEEHKAFMTSCTETPDMKDFCSCSWDALAKTTTADERKDRENPNRKKALAALPEQCGSKMPKGPAKEKFVKGCAKKPEMVAYCECSFDFLDGKGLLMSGAEGVAKVEREMAAACSKTLDLSKAGFVKGCTEKHTEAACTCTYDALEKKVGKDKILAFLQSGTDDMRNAIKSAGTACEAK